MYGITVRIWAERDELVPRAMFHLLLLLCTLVGPGSVVAVSDTRSGMSLTAFPTDVQANVTRLMLTNNQVPDVPTSAVINLPVLSYLGLGKNLLTVFPNLSAVAPSLQKLYAYSNNIAVLDEDLLAVLTKLTHLSLQDNQLISFPTVTSGPALSLQYLNLADNPIGTPPDFSGYTTLSELWLKNTLITEAPTISGASSLTLRKLRLEGTPITHIAPEQIAALVALTDLKIDQSSLRELPSPCLADISVLSISAKALATMFMCSCRQAWLKDAEELGAEILVDDETCPGGRLWSNSTVHDILQQCYTNNTGGIVSENAMRVSGTSYCPFPVHSSWPVHGKAECLSKCLATPACFSFNYQHVRRHCVIIAPGGEGGGGGQGVNIPAVGSSDWRYYILR